jgi:ribosomal protein S18 acetylase RimI-like enzyme
MVLDEKYVHLMDHNYFLSMGLMMSNSMTGEFFDSYSFGIFHSGIPTRDFNVVFIKRKSSKPAKLCEKWERYFAERELPFRVTITPGLEDSYALTLVDRGYKKMESVPVMSLFNIPHTFGERTDLVIKAVKDLTELGHFQEAGEKGFSLPEGSGPFVITEQVLNLPDCDLFIGYCDGRPACTSMLIKTGPVAGIYWVSTIAEYRNHGFGQAITEHAVVSGKNMGCDFACLQASKMGKPVYEKIGFDNPYHYAVYALPD